MPSSIVSAVLLVDGYNIIGTWPCLKKTRDHVGLEAARGELVAAMTNYSAFQGYETQVVFDAQYQNTPSNRETITEFLTVYYTDFGQTADTSLISRLIVATSDRAQQLTVQGYGAEWLSAHQLCGEVETTVCRMRHRYQSKKQPKTRFLAHAIDAKARERLAELRMGL